MTSNHHADRERKTRLFNASLGQSRRRQLLLAEEDGCLPKMTYDSWTEAEQAARRTMDDIAMRRCLLAYQCDFCGHWHVGGDAPRVRNRVLTGEPEGWTCGGWRVLRRIAGTGG